MSNKIEIICSKCIKKRYITKNMFNLIRHKKNSGICKSCSLLGNKRRLGNILSQETKDKIGLKNKNKIRSKEARDKYSRCKKGVIFTEEHRKNLSIAHKGINCGENNFRYIKDRSLLKGGIGSEERRSVIYKDWRRRICNRDNWKCKINDENCKGRLEVHHILSFTKFPELKYNINNGIALCHAHHPRVRAEEKRLVPVFQKLVSVSKE